MAEGLNRVTLVGNLAADAELKFTQGGQAVAKMRVAVNESFAGKDGQRQERVEWVTCVMWGKRAEALNKYLTKGKQVCIEGRLQTRSWEDKDGNKRYATEVNATNLLLLGGRNDAPRRSDESRTGDGISSHEWDGGDDPLPF